MNNKGFGLQQMIIFTFTLLFGLVISAVIANRTFSEKKDIFEEIELANNIDYDKKKNKEINEYKELEDKLEKAASMYLEEHNSSLVKVVNLIKKGYIVKLEDPVDINKTCTGYVEVKKDILSPYIRCEGKYATEGYDMSKEG